MSELTTPIKIDIPGIGSIESADLYLKSEVDEAIEELKGELKDVTDDRNEFKQLYSEQTEKLCIELTNVDTLEQELRKTLRALWIARAERAEESHFMWCQLIYDKKYGIVKFNVKKEWGQNIKQGQTLHTPQGWADVWEDVERKCRAKAEEYK